MQLDLYQSLQAAQRLQYSLKSEQAFTNPELQWRLDELRELMESEMRDHLYFRVQKSLTRFVDGKALFGNSQSELRFDP